MTPVEFLAERYNYITWMRNRDEISAVTADELRAKFLKEAKEKEKQQLVCPHCKGLEMENFVRQRIYRFLLNEYDLELTFDEWVSLNYH